MRGDLSAIPLFRQKGALMDTPMTMISVWLDSQGATTGSMIENMTVCVEESR